MQCSETSERWRVRGSVGLSKITCPFILLKGTILFLALTLGVDLAEAEFALNSSSSGKFVTDLHGFVARDSSAQIGTTFASGPVYLHRSYASFDLSALPVEIGELVLVGSIRDLRPANSSAPFTDYRSMPIEIRQITTPLPDLLAFSTGFFGPEFNTGISIFDDLGSGTLYGQSLVDNGIPPLFGPEPVGPTFSLKLSAEAVNVANLARLGAGTFAIGIHSTNEGMLGIGDLSVQLRVIPVPEPNACLLLVTGLIGVTTFFQTHRRKFS